MTDTPTQGMPAVDPAAAAAADPPATDTGPQMLSRRTAHEGRRVVQRVTFDRELTQDEFHDWLRDNNWLSYHPAGYGPVTITVAGVVGIYVHASSAD